MPPVILLALIGAVGIAGYKLLNGAGALPRSQRQKTANASRRQQVRDLGNLEWDESSGVYRPRSKRES